MTEKSEEEIKEKEEFKNPEIINEEPNELLDTL